MIEVQPAMLMSGLASPQSAAFWTSVATCAAAARPLIMLIMTSASTTLLRRIHDLSLKRSRTKLQQLEPEVVRTGGLRDERFRPLTLSGILNVQPALTEPRHEFSKVAHFEPDVDEARRAIGCRLLQLQERVATYLKVGERIAAIVAERESLLEAKRLGVEPDALVQIRNADRNMIQRQRRATRLGRGVMDRKSHQNPCKKQRHAAHGNLLKPIAYLYGAGTPSKNVTTPVSNEYSAPTTIRPSVRTSCSSNSDP